MSTTRAPTLARGAPSAVVRGAGAVAGGSANVGALYAVGASTSRLGPGLEVAVAFRRTFTPDLMVARAQRQ